MTHFFLFSLLIYSDFLPAQRPPEVGKASYYADRFEGRRTASGAIYQHSNMTAAHRTLPFGTVVKVMNLKNKRDVIVTINDRGPFVRGRIIDLSRSAAQALGFVKEGIAEVSVVVISDDRQDKSQQHK